MNAGGFAATSPLVPLALSGALLLAGAVCAFFSGRLWVWAVGLACACGVWAAAGVLVSGEVWEAGGAVWALRLDAVCAVFLALVGVVGGCGAVYACGVNGGVEGTARWGRFWWCVMLGGIGGVLLAAHGIVFLVAWEVFAVSGYFLITQDRTGRAVRSGGWLYLAASHAGTLVLAGMFAALAAGTGSWFLGPVGDRAELAPLFWAALFGFGIKAGIFPLHFWLPSAHANAPSHVSAILSGVALKVGLYGIVRFSGWLPLPSGAGWVVAGLGGVSALLGVAFALGQHDIKRLLAYHSVENVGIILLGLGFAMLAGTGAALGTVFFAGALLHVWNHGLFKSLLFFGAGSVVHATGTREMSRLGGLWRVMPWTASLFALGAVAIVGLPPLNGFLSEWLIYNGFFGAVLSDWPAGWVAGAGAVVLAVTGALALACFVKVCGVVFLGAPRSEDACRAHECGMAGRAAMVVPAALCVLTGLLPLVSWPLLARAAAAWNPQFAAHGSGGQALLPSLGALAVFQPCLVAAAAAAGLLLWWTARRTGIRRGPTWDCGYAAPTPRMQYSAESFASILTPIFRFALRTETRTKPPRGPFPASASRRTRTPETILENVLAPCASAVLVLADLARRIQHGRVQMYLLYLFVACLAVAALSILWQS
jgi:hydrogenase-4 component B